MTTYPGARLTRWYESKFRGSRMKPNCGVIHTTEGTSLPGYSGGSTAPNYTAVPDFEKKQLVWYAHFNDETSSRALRNLAGGVETNTANALQVELVGTCDPSYRERWNGARAGRDYIFWPDAPDWALQELAEFVAWVNKKHGVKITSGATWKPYPTSYADGGNQRFSHARWRSFKGWCGHQHVPENVHGDPGDLDWAAVERRARAIVGGPVKQVVRVAGRKVLPRVRYVVTNVRGTDARTGPSKEHAVTRHYPQDYEFTCDMATKNYRRHAKPIEWFPARDLGRAKKQPRTK